MTDSWHPDDNQCALFLEGALDDVTTNEITRHLATCNDCLEIIGGSAKSLRERAWWQQPTLWRVAAAVVIAVVGLALFWQWRSSSGIAEMAAVGPQKQRVSAARLTAFPYAPHNRMRGSDNPENNEPDDTAHLMLQAKADDVIDRSGKSSSASAAHAVGVAWLVLGEKQNAIAALTKATERNPKDPHAWNDLAVAQYELRDYKGALASIDRALKLDPKLADAWFNRAVILHDQGSRQALDAWRAYLKIDPNSAWADEARGKIESLTTPP